MLLNLIYLLSPHRIPLFLPSQTGRDCSPPLHVFSSPKVPAFQSCPSSIIWPSTEGPLVPHVSPFKVPSPPQWKVVGARPTGARGTIVITWCHLRAPSKTPGPVIKRKGAPLSLSLSIHNLCKGHMQTHKTRGGK